MIDRAGFAKYENLVGDEGGLSGDGVLGLVGDNGKTVGSLVGSKCANPKRGLGESSSTSLLAVIERW